MLSRFFISLIYIFLFAINTLKASEFPNDLAYAKKFPNGVRNGTDGNWTTADRRKRNHIWHNANLVNLSKNDGYLQYLNINERADFLLWFQKTTDKLNLKTKWAGIAGETASNFKKLLSPISIVVSCHSQQIKNFIINGNSIIFSHLWPDLEKLIQLKQLTPPQAKEWDMYLLHKEQNLVQPYCEALDIKSVKRLTRMVRKENLLSRLFCKYEFEGDLLNLSDRCNYAEKMMGYR